MPALTILNLNNAARDVDHIADIATATELTATDRLGNSKRTLAGFEQYLDDVIQTVTAGIGYQPPVAYTAGISLTMTTQTVEYLDEVYSPKIGDLPFVTSGVFETAKFRLIQGLAAADLALDTGADLSGFSHSVTYSSGTLGLKGRQLVSVKDAPINAACDGVTDDYATLISYINSVGGNVVLVFPADTTTMVSAALPFRTGNGYVCLDGYATIKAHASSTDNVVGEAHPAAPATRVILRNIIVDGNSANCAYNTHFSGGVYPDDAYQNGIRLNEVSFSLFDNVLVQNSVMNGWSVYNVSSDNEFRSIQARDIGKSTTPGGGAYSYNGIFVEFGCDRNVFHKPIVHTPRQAGIWETTNGADNYDNHYFYPLIISPGGDGFVFDCSSGTNTTHRPWVIGPKVLFCSGVGAVGVRIRASVGAAVVDPYIESPVVEQCTNGIIAQNSVTRLRLINPSVRLCSNNGIQLDAGSVDAIVVGGQSLGNSSFQYLNQGTRTICYGLVQGTSGEFSIDQKAVVTTDPRIELRAASGVAPQYSLNQSGIVNWTINNTATSGMFSIANGGLGDIVTITTAGAVTIGIAGGKVGFLGASAIVRPVVTGSRGGNAALASALVALNQLGLITNSSTA